MRGGRKIYRHGSNEGSVIEIDYWGTPMKLFVADAKYRATNLAYDTTVRLHGNPALTGAPIDDFYESGYDWTEPLPYIKDDAWVQSTYAALKKDGTAKSNTDILMGFDTTEAAHHCRSQDIPGVGQLDLPNLYELIILYLESDRIDALDPTAADNRDKALGMMNPHGRFNLNNQYRVWSSAEYSDWYAWNVHCYGYANSEYQHAIYGVTPVKELDA